MLVLDDEAHMEHRRRRARMRRELEDAERADHHASGRCLVGHLQDERFMGCAAWHVAVLIECDTSGDSEDEQYTTHDDGSCNSKACGAGGRYDGYASRGGSPSRTEILADSR